MDIKAKEGLVKGLIVGILIDAVALIAISILSIVNIGDGVAELWVSKLLVSLPDVNEKMAIVLLFIFICLLTSGIGVIYGKHCDSKYRKKYGLKSKRQERRGNKIKEKVVNKRVICEIYVFKQKVWKSYKAGNEVIIKDVSVPQLKCNDREVRESILVNPLKYMERIAKIKDVATVMKNYETNLYNKIISNLSILIEVIEKYCE